MATGYKYKDYTIVYSKGNGWVFEGDKKLLGPLGHFDDATDAIKAVIQKHFKEPFDGVVELKFDKVKTTKTQSEIVKQDIRAKQDEELDALRKSGSTEEELEELFPWYKKRKEKGE